MAIIGKNMSDEERNRADMNNANNIRRITNVAAASASPHVRAVGKAVKTADKLTHGAVSNGAGRLVTRANNTNPLGRGIQNLSNKAASSGDGDVAQRKLQKNKNNRNSKIGSTIKNKLNPFKGKDENSTENNNLGDGSSSTETKDAVSKGFVRVVKKIGIPVAAILFFIMFIVVAVSSLFGGSVASAFPMISPNTYETNSFKSSYEKGTKEYENEIAYYEKLKSVSSNFTNAYGEALKTNYIHVLLIEPSIGVSGPDLSNTDSTVLIDYKKMSDMVDTIVSLMTPSDSTKNVDYEKNGEFYNNLLNSVEFKNYYKELLEKRQRESNSNKTLDQLLIDVLGEMFDQAEKLDEMANNIDFTTITTETKVTITEKVDNGNNSSKQQTTTVTINEYLADSIYAKSTDLSNSEITKAYTVGYSTNLAAQNKKLSVDSNNANASNNTCSVTKGCSYDKNGNLIAGAGSQSGKNTNFYNGKYYYKKPLTEEEINNLNKDINSVFGNVLVNSDGTYPELDIDKINGLGDGDYKSILTKGYGKLEYKNIGENSYILDGSYGTKKVLTNVTFYDQNDYSEYNFCGKKKETIKSSGCGVTAMAMIVSTYEKDTKKYTPVDMMKAARSGGYCGGGISGTSPGFFKKEASTMKYKYYYASKYNKYDLNLILKHLSQGDLVIAHMLAGHFTSGGHYMVLGGVDPETKKVYVYDPYNKVNKSYRKTGNGWYSFNDLIVKEAKAFYIVWKG